MRLPRSFHPLVPGRLALLTLLAVLVAWPATPARAGIHVAVLPGVQSITPGSGFDVTLEVSLAGSPFNAYKAVISYDPAAITYIGAGSGEGCYMLGTCGGGCGGTFPLFSAAGDSLVINHSLLCDQLSLPGPGELYKLHFGSSLASQVTNIRIRYAEFVNAGVIVTPVTTFDARVGIGVPLGVDAGPVMRLSVHAQPNPAHGPVALAIESPVAGMQRVDVLDLSGRLVRRLASGWSAAGARSLTWDGTDTVGAPLPAGIYLVRARVGDAVTRTRVTLVR